MPKGMKRPGRRKPARITPPRRGTPGAPPGTLKADPHAPKPVLYGMAFADGHLEERALANVQELAAFIRPEGTIWVNVDGLGDAETIRQIGEVFSLHPLALEDVMNVHQRAKAETYEDHLFFVLRMACPAGRVKTEQVAVFLGDRYVLTFQEGIEGDAFDPVRERLRTQNGRMRKMGADYLAYSLIDAVVDNYFPLLERYGDRLDVLEEMVITQPSNDTLNLIHEMKRDLLSLRKAFWPLREAVSGLTRDAIPQIKDETRVYFRDVHDHIIQVIDILETYRELSSALMDVYLSSVSNRMNEVMKLLTIIATIFIPLTFIAGVYGMNFDPDVSPYNMPELKWRYGYPASLILMGGSAVALLIYFQRKGWLGSVMVQPVALDACESNGDGNGKTPRAPSKSDAAAKH